MAQQAGATILTQTKVEWLEKLADGTWRIHGQHVLGFGQSESFTLDARQVVLSAGSLNSTEILLRSEANGLSVSPALGTKFNGNGDFFGVAYNGFLETDVLGYPYKQGPGSGDSPEPGPNIVGLVRYNGTLPEAQRIAIEDFSFPSAYVAGAKAIFGAIRGQDTVTGNEAAQQQRWLRDFDPTDSSHDPGGAMNHSMLYLVMGQDNARGTILFDAPLERARRQDHRLLGPGRPAADLHPHERRTAPPRPGPRGQLHLQPHLEHLQSRPPHHRTSPGWLSHGRRLYAGCRGPLRPRFLRRR
jgi:cholesterol oxidase